MELKHRRNTYLVTSDEILVTSKRGTELRSYGGTGVRRDWELVVWGDHFFDEGDLAEVVVTVFDDTFDVSEIGSVSCINEGSVECAVVHGFDFGGKLFGID